MGPEIVGWGALVPLGVSPAIVCAVPVASDLGLTGDTPAGYAEAGFDDAVLLFAPGDPDPAYVRSRLSRRPGQNGGGASSSCLDCRAAGGAGMAAGR